MDRTTGENLKLSTGDLVVNYDDNGPVYATPVVFIHSTPFNKGIWDLQAETLKSNYRVIAYDLRGHGGTVSTSSEPCSIGQFTEDLMALLDGLGLSRVILCGVSLGGHIVLDAVEKYPERFIAIVLAGTQCSADPEDVKQHREQAIQLLDKGGVEAYTNEAMKNWFAKNSFTTRKEEVRAVRNMALATPPDTVRQTLRALSERRDSCGNLWTIKCPALILTGKEDQVATPETANFMRDNLAGSEVHLIEYAGHLANLENTHEFNTLLKRFVDRVSERNPHSRQGSAAKKEPGKAVAGPPH
jgi:3-oxoadipate enol-lactonase